MSLEIPTYNSLLAVTKNLNSLAADLQTQIDMLNQGPPKLNSLLGGLTAQQGFWFDASSTVTCFTDLNSTTPSGTSGQVARMWDRNGNWSARYISGPNSYSLGNVGGTPLLVPNTSNSGPLFIQNAYMTGVTDEYTLFLRARLGRTSGYGVMGLATSGASQTTDGDSLARMSLYTMTLNSTNYLMTGAFGAGDVGIRAPFNITDVYSIVIRAKMGGVVTMAVQPMGGTPNEYVGFAGTRNLFPTSGTASLSIGGGLGLWPWPITLANYVYIYQAGFLTRYITDQERDILLNGTSDPLTSFTPPA